MLRADVAVIFKDCDHCAETILVSIKVNLLSQYAGQLVAVQVVSFKYVVTSLIH